MDVETPLACRFMHEEPSKSTRTTLENPTAKYELVLAFVLFICHYKYLWHDCFPNKFVLIIESQTMSRDLNLEASGCRYARLNTF